eukprot:gnl/Dysnectes_brevis/265_a296_4466.p1 GENE.gnl/Dysnectes_brevis/265_a296_4466~~gnl/Dysnectes_brevis/265_a296_4466.p1  ORF type:complete len:350 (+),score=62.36 gnl/Dysnectes_brevis/265_a296_4466:115-1164(+)
MSKSTHELTAREIERIISPTQFLSNPYESLTPEAPFQIPLKAIIGKRHLLSEFQRSPIYKYLIDFVFASSQAIQGKSYQDADKTNMSPFMTAIDDMLTSIDAILDTVEPLEKSYRYGNPAFRKFCLQLIEQAPDLVKNTLPESRHIAVPELIPYLVECFGEPARLDYGTGHELNFILFMICYFRLNVLKADELMYVPLVIFPHYLAIARKAQAKYLLEPAGSHGAWCVDDYQMLPFVWGASQRVGAFEGPTVIFDRLKCRDLSDHDLYMEGMWVIHQAKRVDLRECAPFIADIHLVPGTSWKKISGGMLKLWVNETLGKWPVVQHVRCGYILPFKQPAEGSEDLEEVQK